MSRPLDEQITLRNMGIACLAVFSIVMIVALCSWGCSIFMDKEDGSNSSKASLAQDGQLASLDGEEAEQPETSAEEGAGESAAADAPDAGEDANAADVDAADADENAKAADADAADSDDVEAADEADSKDAADGSESEEPALSEEEAAALAEAELEQAIEEGNIINTWQLPDSTYIYETSIDDLMHADAYFDGQSVQITGEAVGDAVLAGVNIRHRWVTVESETGAFVSVYMAEDQAALIDTFGAYGKTGTMLQIRGKYHLVCQDHQGESDIHAESVVVVAAGQAEPDEFDLKAFFPGVLTLVLGGGLMALFATIRNRRR